MQKVCTSYANYFNSKYEESGRIFEGPYKFKIINSEEYLQYVDAYIQIINPFELMANGVKNFDKAFEEAANNPFCSLGESFGKRKLSIVDRKMINDRFPSIEIYKKFVKDILISKKGLSLPAELLKPLLIDQI
jgi:hypothetical protein